MTFVFTTPIKSNSNPSSHTNGFITPTVIIDNSYDIENENNSIRITIKEEKSSTPRKPHR
jgi:hypothetical protein